MLSPKDVVDLWDIRPEMKVADFGCGAGHYSLEIARRLGGDGMVYAFDIQEEVLGALKSRCTLEHLPNIEFRRVDLELENGSGLSENLVDMVILSNILFQVENKDAVVREVARVLRPGGQAMFIEWDMKGVLGPPKDMRIKKDEAIELFKKNALFLHKEFEAGQYHYGIIFKKK
jgi:ubiquinone/menaquinone biosynthesis C-methylase UbiE